LNGWSWRWAMAWNMKCQFFTANFFIAFGEYHSKWVEIPKSANIIQRKYVLSIWKRNLILIRPAGSEPTGSAWGASHVFFVFFTAYTRILYPTVYKKSNIHTCIIYSIKVKCIYYIYIARCSISVYDVYFYISFHSINKPILVQTEKKKRKPTPDARPYILHCTWLRIQTNSWG
jgi:hypothetical protein